MSISELLSKYGLTVPDDKANEFGAEFDTEFKAAGELEAKTQELATKQAEIAGLKSQIKARDGDIKELKEAANGSEEYKAKLAELEAKYNSETEKLNAQIQEMELDHATEKFFSPIPFASELARKAAVSEFKAKGFKMENGKFVGGDEFIAELKKADPKAFVEEKPPEPPPQFTHLMGRSEPAGEINPFSFQFSNLVRQPPEPANQ